MKDPWLPPTVPIEKKEDPWAPKPENLPVTSPEATPVEAIEEEFYGGIDLPPGAGIFSRLTTWPERQSLKWGTKLAEERAKFIQAHTAIVAALRQANEEKVRFQQSANLDRKWYESQMKELEYKIWELKKQKKVKEAEFNALIAAAKQKERDAAPEND